MAESLRTNLGFRVTRKKHMTALSDILRVIEKNGFSIDSVERVETSDLTEVHSLSVSAKSARDYKALEAEVLGLTGVYRVTLSDPLFDAHLGGKIEVNSKAPLTNRSELARVYTPGFAHVARAIAETPDLVYRYSIKGNAVAIVTDGTAVSGLGDIGPEAAIPVMEGKAILFKTFAGIDAFPICLGTKDSDEIVRVVKALEPQFSAIMLEDIAAPRCFEIETRLRDVLRIPVCHDDQHCTAVSAAAALINTCRMTGRIISDLKIVVVGAGAAGTACTRLFKFLGAQNLVVCDRKGALHRKRDSSSVNSAKRWLIENTNPHQESGSLREVLIGADVFLGVAGPGAITVSDIKTMKPAPIIFALSNPQPEIMPHEVVGAVSMIATGRSDLPNQIDGGLCYPGLFRGALDCRACEINDEMKLAAAYALANLIPRNELGPERIVPSIFDEAVVPAVAAAVIQAAIKTGVASHGRGMGQADVKLFA
jgi:malate dehydrogenase (oxaloacetate-decarboxylating)